METILKIHVESKNEGVKYSCLKCDYATTTTSNLKRHVENKHEGISLSHLGQGYLTPSEGRRSEISLP